MLIARQYTVECFDTFSSFVCSEKIFIPSFYVSINGNGVVQPFKLGFTN